MQRTRNLTMLLVIGLTMPVTAESPRAFRYWKPINSSVDTQEEIIAFGLDSEVYAATRPGFPDLRVLNAQGQEVPYQLEPDVEYREETTRQLLETEIVSLREEGSAIEVHIRLPENSPSADGFLLETPQTDYERKIAVSGSSTGTDWKPLVTDHIIFDFSRYMDVHNREIPLPANEFREFKIVFGDVTDEQPLPFKELARFSRGDEEQKRVERTLIERRTFRIDRLRAWHNVTQQRVRRVKKTFYPAAGFESQENADDQLTILTVQTQREPLTSFTLQTTSRNFYRRATVEVPVVQGVRTEWRQIGSTVVSHFGFRSFHREQVKVDFSERRESTYRIVIHNEDNPPLDIQRIQPEGTAYRVVLLALPDQRYRLYYGAENVDSPQYEAATVLTALRKEDFQPVTATLAAQTENADFADRPGPSLKNLLNNWVFLGSVIVVMVVVLGWSLYRAGHHLEQLSDKTE